MRIAIHPRRVIRPYPMRGARTLCTPSIHPTPTCARPRSCTILLPGVVRHRASCATLLPGVVCASTRGCHPSASHARSKLVASPVHSPQPQQRQTPSCTAAGEEGKISSQVERHMYTIQYYPSEDRYHTVSAQRIRTGGHRAPLFITSNWCTQTFGCLSRDSAIYAVRSSIAVPQSQRCTVDVCPPDRLRNIECVLSTCVCSGFVFENMNGCLYRAWEVLCLATHAMGPTE